ncbi:translation initiation factor IF-2 [Candidatus Pacearchaeota archaeon]|nr:translation initiation factor IF-2 [Candidatus Pacearchaeota archaeon]
MKNKIRQPIVTVAGHVDHGKTSILDSLRDSSIQAGEAGGITQKISFTLYPIEQMKKSFPIVEKLGDKLEIPGFLFIDTPGHASFTNLRKRGGSLADLAILVIDINEGIKPQTQEVIQILKMNKTPFIVALNKIDNISGWRSLSRVIHNSNSESETNKNPSVDLKANIESQAINVKQAFDEKYLTIVGSFSAFGYDAELFYKISDFTKNLALIPCSARTKEGIPELVMMLCGLSQKYLSEKLSQQEEAKGVILEIKKENAMNFSEAILYEGELKKNDEIAVADIDGNPRTTKIRILEEIKPLSSKFQPKDKVHAATGLKMQFKEKFEILPGMPFMSYKNNLNEIKNIFKKEILENIKTDNHGIIAKADSLGSLEALLALLKDSNIPVLKAGIGNIKKSDINSAKANLKINEIDAVIAGFNVSVDEDTSISEKLQNDVKIITDEVIYKLIDSIKKSRDEKSDEIEKKKLIGLGALFKLQVLGQFIFRNTKPAIFGVRVETGKAVPNINMIDEGDEKISRIKNMQSENKSVSEATQGMELAISVPGLNFERQMKNKKFIYSDLSESQFRNLKKNKDILSSNEMKLLQEIAEIKRKKKSNWGE